MKKSFEEIIKGAEFLIGGYFREMRTMTNLHRLDCVKKRNPSYVYDPEDELIRENLMEHVGSLPVMAVYFHGLIEENVDLGRVLEMLAIHDIGELATGDKNVFVKKEDEAETEKREALKLLDERRQALYLEFEAVETNEAKFAKSIDKIVPDFLDLMAGKDLTEKRLKHFANLEPNQIIDTIEKFKSPYMQWSPFFKEFHGELIKRMRMSYDI
ncbi:MAG: HD domain-containing protein [bacterium]|nr:HD domain-containing protein [bacterium]